MRAGPGPQPLIGFYLLYFGTIGVLMPFLPAYLASLHLTASEIGILLAVNPALAMAAPPLWGRLADRTGRPDRVLSAIALGATLSFAPLLAVERFPAVLLVLSGYAFFASSITTVLDSLAIRHVAAQGGSYARIRLFGSLGFVLSSTLFGLSVGEVGRATVLVPLVLMAGYFLWSLRIDPPDPVASVRQPAPGRALVKRRDLALLLAATCVHWIACSPFNVTFPLHVTALGLDPWVIGVSAGLGVAAEIAVMFAYPRFAGRIAPRHLLFVAFAASAARWMGMAIARQPEALVLLSLLHGLTFGAFYVASIGYLAHRVPKELQATGQALFVSITFGLGGLVGYASSGVGYDLLGGGHRLFVAAAAVELAAALLALRLPPPEPSPVSSDARPSQA